MAQPATVVVNVNDVQALRALDNIARKFNDVGRRMQAIGKAMSLAGAAGSAPFGLSVRTFAAVDDNLRTIKAITGGTAEDMERLRDAAKSFRSNTPAEVARELQFLAQAGYSASEAIQSVPDALALIRLDPKLAEGRAAEIIGDIAKPFQLGISETQRIADVVAVSASKSTTDVEQIGIAMGYAAGQAKAANLTLEETGAIFAVLSNSGIKGSRAGTALGRMLRIITSERGQKKLSDILDVETIDKSTGELRNIADVFKDIQEATKGLGSGERVGVFNKIFGATGAEPALALANMAEQIAPLVAEMSKAEGQARAMADEINAGAGGALRSFRSDVSSISESVGKQLAPVLVAASERFHGVAQSIQAVVEANPELIQAAATSAAGLSALGAANLTVGISMQAVSAAMATTSRAGANLLTVINAVTHAHVRSAAAATASAVAHAALAAAKITAATSGIALVVGAGAVVALGQAFVGLGTAIAAANFGPEFAKQSGTVRILARALQQAFDQAKLAVRIAWGAIRSLSERGLNALKAIGKSIANVLLDPVQAVRGAILFAKKLFEPVVKQARAILGVISPVLGGIADFIGASLARAFEFLGTIARPVISAMSQIAKAAFGFIAPVIDLIRNLVTTAASNAYRLGAPFRAAFGIALSEAGRFATGTISFLGGLFSELSQSAYRLTTIFGDAFGQIGTAARAVVDLIRAGEFQLAFEVIGDTATSAMKLAFAAIRVEWIQLVHYFATSFDSFIQGTFRAIADAAAKMRNAVAPLAQDFDYFAGLAGIESNLFGSVLGGTAEIQAAMADAGKALSDEMAKAGAQFQTDLAEATLAVQAAQDALARVAQEATFKRDLAIFENNLQKGLQAGAKALYGALYGTGAVKENPFDRLKAAANEAGQLVGQGLAFASDYMRGTVNQVAAAAAEAEQMFQSQVFGGASKQLIDQQRDAIGNQQLDVAKEQLKALKGIEEGVEDLELGFG